MVLKRNILFDCIENPSYYDYVENGYNTMGCGNLYLAVITFNTFAIIVNLIFLNLFIAIILDSYEETTDRKKRMFNNEL